MLRNGDPSQDRATEPALNRSVDGAPHGWRQRNQRELVALAQDPEHAVSVHFLKRLDVRARCLEDAQSEEAQHGYQGEVVDVRRLSARGEHGLELQVAQASVILSTPVGDVHTRPVSAPAGRR